MKIKKMQQSFINYDLILSLKKHDRNVYHVNVCKAILLFNFKRIQQTNISIKKISSSF